VNLNYITTELNVTASNETFYCIRTVSDCNGDQLARNILSEWTGEILQNGEWAAVTKALDDVIERQDYQIDRAADSMLAIISIASILIVFSVCALEGVRSTSRENALLRSLGVRPVHITATHFATVIGLLLFGLMILLAYGPLYSAVSLEVCVHQYGLDTLMYPVALFPTYPAATLAFLFSLFIFCALSAYVVAAVLSRETSLVESLGATWTAWTFDGGME
jgi:hypothetical protein